MAKIVFRRRTALAALACLAVAAAGAGAVSSLLRARVYEPELHPHDFYWVHKRGETRRVTPARPLILPAFADFDLLVAVELHEQAELDLVVRRVEPSFHRRGGGDEEERVPFHGRFDVVRLSAQHEGPGYRTRAQALFDDAVVGGVRVAPGLPASVLVQGRGHQLRANVAGRWLPAIETLDDYGGLALVARGGPVLVHYLKVLALDDPGWPLWLWGALAGGAAALLATWFGAAPLGLLFGAALIAAGGMLADALVFRHALVDPRPDPVALLVGALSLLPVGVAVAVPRRRGFACLLALVVSAALLESAARRAWPWLTVAEDPRLDLYFGPASGVAPFDALSREVHDRGPMVHNVDPVATRVMFLGGALLFEASPDNGEAVGWRTTIALRARLGGEIDGVVFSTATANATQQLLLLRRFYLDYAPNVVVFGVTAQEGAALGPRSAREVFAATASGFALTTPSFALGQLLRSPPAAVASASPADLAATLDELADLADQRGFAVVLVAGPELDPERRAVLDARVRAHAWPLIEGVVGSDGGAHVEPLVDAVAGALARPR